MRLHLLVPLTIFAAGVFAKQEHDPLIVCCTTPDLAALVREVGGESVTATSFCRGGEDPHFVEARPSFIRRVNRADLVVANGMDLEEGWLPILLRSGRNPRVLPGRAGFLDASKSITPLDVPKGRIDRSHGHVHAAGNPHYLLDPENGVKVARAILRTLKKLRPNDATSFASRFERFQESIAAKQKKWQADLARYNGRAVVTDHQAWTYFLRRFGLTRIGTLEPKPGVEPHARHLLSLVRVMKDKKATAILVLPYTDMRHAKFAASRAGARIARMAHQVGAVAGADDYISMVEHNVRAVAQALGS